MYYYDQKPAHDPFWWVKRRREMDPFEIRRTYELSELQTLHRKTLMRLEKLWVTTKV